ncbi:MAG: hypothetical protein ACOCTG_06515, partial [Bacteroidota bacterium]
EELRTDGFDAKAPELGETTTETVNTGMPSAGAYVMPRENTDFILGLVDWAGIERPVATSVDGLTNPPLSARLHETNDGYILFLINYNADPQDVDVDVLVNTEGSFTLRELTTEEERTIEASNGQIRIETHVDGRGTRAWAISSER